MTVFSRIIHRDRFIAKRCAVILIAVVGLHLSACSNPVQPKVEQSVNQSAISQKMVEPVVPPKQQPIVLKQPEQARTEAQVSQEAWRQLEALALKASSDLAHSQTFVQQQSPTKTVEQSVYGRLLKHFNEWQGAPYQYGGQKKSGVDCSAFVQITYAEKFKVNLPRTTEDQIRRGKKVRYNQLKTGDVVFFKTGWSTYHNGIYLGDQEFMHASSSKGVIVSKINQNYWRSRFIEARRLLN
ncbi:C40 family peptidase [Thiomicrorhabdus sp. 6S2-11]|uniref:C40 family peptidase n=1 Tax=Thiomicrorhabdus marina TaxID=2818442 RepID=A0ABS3Q370_9GAMM|nr:NlpC/P60 family protein [Thiomicrorhabdus marina]MBO1926752.1 C40 family peptidase [Thiomicrorhabdus marina]